MFQLAWRLGSCSKSSVCALVASLLAGGLFASSAGAATKLRLATVANPDSFWGTTFRTWRKAVESKTGSRATLEFFFNGTMGSDATVVDKIKAGQLDGASLTSVGLGRIDRKLLVMQLPGVIRSWAALDAVRATVSSDLEKVLTDRKLTLVTWGDIGQAHFLSKGFDVRTPSDMAGHAPWANPGDPVSAAIFRHLPKANPFTAELMGVLPAIETGKIDCLSIPALAAEMLQWNSKFDRGVDRVNAIAVGALILSSESLDKLPADLRAAYVDTGRAMSSSAAGLRQKIRNEDAAAWDRFKTRAGVKIIVPTTAETETWRPVFKSAIAGLRGAVLDAALVDRVVAAAAP